MLTEMVALITFKSSQQYPQLPRAHVSSAMAPTPESAAFLAKKPTVPPTFDGVDYDDTKALKQAQDSILREQWVKSMMARLVREELGKCYYREGVNHLENCGALRGELISLGAREPVKKSRLLLEWKIRKDMVTDMDPQIDILSY